MQLPNSRSLEINRLSSVFNNTTATYKFYWFVSILNLLTQKGKTQMPFWEIICGMVAESWYPIHYFKLSFGKSDSLFQKSKEIEEFYNIPIDIRKDELSELLTNNLNDSKLKTFLNVFTKNVVLEPDSVGFQHQLIQIKQLAGSFGVIETIFRSPPQGTQNMYLTRFQRQGS